MFTLGPTMIQITRAIGVNEGVISERFVRATGPGGQNTNQDATAVELRLDIGRAALPPDLKERLIALGGRHVTTDDVLVVVGRASRSQAQNRDAAWARLVALLKRAAAPPKRRKATKPGPLAREQRLVSKHRHGAIKRSRSGPDEE